MKFRSLAVVGIAVLIAGLAFQMAPAQSADKATHPVSYRFLVDVLNNAQRASAPGANDWSCKPSAAHPRPVVLVHGTGGNAATNWGTYSALLANEGYCVYALTYGDTPLTQFPAKLGGIGDIRTSAKQLKRFVAKVRTSTGAAKVDLVGHSQGTLMPNYYVRFLGGHDSVKRYISIAPVWHGEGGDSFATLATFLAALGVPQDNLPVCTACRQMTAGSPFMNKMRSGKLAHPAVDYTNIVSKFDEVVFPYTSGIQTGYPNMKNIVLQDVCGTDFSEHLQIAASPNVARLVLNELDPAHAKPVKCKLQLPLLG